MPETRRPSPKQLLDPASNPALATPSKRMWLLGVGLASTSSASFLVTKARVTHLEMKGIINPPVLEHVPDELEFPDWNLLHSSAPLSSYTQADLEERCRYLEQSFGFARKRMDAQDIIIQGQNAQMIVQNMGMEKMNCTLHEKEKPKRSDRSVLFPGGKGRHLMDPEVIQLKRQLEEERKQGEVQKEQRKEARVMKKAAKVRLEERWKEVCQVHDTALVAWREEFEMQKAEGIAVKNLPKKPKRPLKASLQEEEQGGSDEDDDMESNDE